ncbi:hypothetical protein FOL47_005403 [Perkinsus chesapeaki]|uniref:Cyclic nucleotide-binding domain-containing protein n=1 Tax=Perkinsus chesapeaki TaxID=330153 RepID=A0A7J6N396_PERCH|nr:hypothetical protein FOL47_005403 [Perkinsus chesapeaki]
MPLFVSSLQRLNTLHSDEPSLTEEANQTILSDVGNSQGRGRQHHHGRFYHQLGSFESGPECFAKNRIWQMASAANVLASLGPYIQCRMLLEGEVLPLDPRCYYVVNRGKLKVPAHGGEVSTVLGRGGCFGEANLLGSPSISEEENLAQQKRPTLGRKSFFRQTSTIPGFRRPPLGEGEVPVEALALEWCDVRLVEVGVCRDVIRMHPRFKEDLRKLLEDPKCEVVSPFDTGIEAKRQRKSCNRQPWGYGFPAKRESVVKEPAKWSLRRPQSAMSEQIKAWVDNEGVKLRRAAAIRTACQATAGVRPGREGLKQATHTYCRLSGKPSPRGRPSTAPNSGRRQASSRRGRIDVDYEISRRCDQAPATSEGCCREKSSPQISPDSAISPCLLRNVQRRQNSVGMSQLITTTIVIKLTVGRWAAISRVEVRRILLSQIPARLFAPDQLYTLSLMDFEFKSAVNKRQSELRKRAAQLRKRQEHDRKIREEAAARTEELLQANTQRKIQTRMAEVRDEGAPDGGVSFEESFQWMPSDALRGDRVDLPQEVLEKLQGFGDRVKFPLMFELYNPSNDARLHCGVREFSAPNGQVLVGPQLKYGLGLLPGQTLRLRYKVLPLCTSVKLVASGASLGDYRDFRAVLERFLSANFCTLTLGQVFDVGGVKVQVAGIEPGPAVCVVNTDVDLDLTTKIEAADGIGSIELDGPAVNVPAHDGEAAQFRLVLSDAARNNLSNDERLVVSASSGEVFVSTYPLVEATPVSYMWSSGANSEPVVSISLSDVDECLRQFDLSGNEDATAVWPEVIYIGVSDADDACELSVKTSEKESPAALGQGANDQLATCRNCQRRIPAATLSLHELRCQRLYVQCPTCHQAIQRDKWERHVHCDVCKLPCDKDKLPEHRRIYHTPIDCPDCGQHIPQGRFGLLAHRRDSCPQRPHLCRFCKLYVPMEGDEAEDARDRMMGLSVHEARCGNRTDACPDCGRLVRLKDMELHMVAVHSSEGTAAATATPVTLEPCPICGRRDFATLVDLSAHVSHCVE